MRTGKSLTQLAQELTRINETKRDFITPIAKVQMNRQGNIIFGNEEFGMTTWADQQTAAYLDIPKSYYDRLRTENVQLLSQNVNHGFSKNPQDKRMLRVLDGRVRAMLSNRYRRMDSYDLMQTVLPIMLETEMSVISSDITERRLYVRALMPKLQTDIKVGDPVQYGLQISSSDVGAGSLRVEPLIFRLVCLNGLITEHAMKKYHVGRVQCEGDDIFELMSDETVALDEAAFWAKCRDVVLASLKPEVFEQQVDKLRAAADRTIKNFDLAEVVELTCKAVGYSTTKDVKQGILEALASGNQGAGLTQWGLANSFTAVAAHNESVGFDDVVELERVGGKIIDLKPDQWHKIAG
jgi:hypothetical protein